MSTTAAVNPVNVIQAVAPAARQSDAAPDVPFNQVLSREIADRRGAGNDAGGGAAQPNVPAAPAQAPGAAKANDSDDAGNLAAKRPDDGGQAVDAASAEMLALVNSMVQAAGLAAASPAPAAAAPGAAIAASRAGNALAAADPAVLGRSMPRTSQAQAKIPVAAQTAVEAPEMPAATDAPLQVALKPAATDLPAPAAAKPAAAPEVPAAPPDLSGAPADPALPGPAALKPGADTAPNPGAADQAQAALATAARQAGVPAAAELKVAQPAAPAGQPGEAAAVKREAAPNPLAKDPAVEQISVKPAAAAPSESAAKIGTAHAAVKESAAKPAETAAETSAKQPAAKAPEAPKAASAMPAFESEAVKVHESAAAAAAPAPASATIGAQVQQAAAFAVEAAAGHASEKLSPRVGTPAWDQALGQKVVWMVAGGVQSASLTLNPPDLGPLQVVLNVSNSQADASFIAPHAETRQALEASMPRLREMLADSGIQLGQSTVSAGTQQNQYNGPSGQAQPSVREFSQAAPAADAALAVPRPAASLQNGNGLVDTFA